MYDWDALIEMNPELVKFQRMYDELEEKERDLKIREADLERRTRLFERQWKLLEHELMKLAGEKERFQKEKAFFEAVKQNAQKQDRIAERSADKSLNAKMFFLGVHDELSLKKRYRDLIKVYHPDSLNGDMHAMQAILKEYDDMKKAYDVI